MGLQFTTLDAPIGLVITILLIIKEVQPACDLILGALIGRLIDDDGLVGMVSTIVSDAGSMMSSVLRILISGVLAGTLIKTGAAQKIAETIADAIGEKRATVALTVVTMVICVVGVFIDIAVITVASITLATDERAGPSKSGIPLAMIGSGKAGNIVSPNPNTTVVIEAFKLNLTAVVMKNLIPALCALIATIVLTSLLVKKAGDGISQSDLEAAPAEKLPNALQAFAGPLTVIVLLVLRPLAKISVDPLIALPLGSPVCILVTGNIRNLIPHTDFGLLKVIGVAILLIGTGTIVGTIKASALQKDVTVLLSAMNMPASTLAPLSGILMAAVITSTAAGSTAASQTFSGTLLSVGVPVFSAAAMIHTGTTALDSLPYGPFFHTTGGSVYMDIKNRMKLILLEALIGLTSTIVAVILYLVAV